MLNMSSKPELMSAAGFHQEKQNRLDVNIPGFIYHPIDVPLNIKKISQLPALTRDEIKSGRSSLGLCFASNRHFKPGTLIQLSIPLRGEVHKFIGLVTLVKQNLFGYDIGIWLRTQSDAYRARIIEQICYIDCYLEEKQEDCVSPIDKEHEAEVWILHNAAHFPV